MTRSDSVPDLQPPADRNSGPPDRVRLPAVLALACALLIGCAGKSLPDNGGDEKRSPSEQVTFELNRSIGFVDDPRLLAYVDEVGGRITRQGSRKDLDFRFYILDMPVPNALALPEGQIFVSRGVLILINSEDELAGILAHEIAHLEMRHPAERQNLDIVTSPIRIGAGIAGWATGLIIPGLGDAIVELGESTSGLVLAPYSREQEREADRVGQSLAAAAGYQPAGLVNLLETMANAEALNPDSVHEQSFFDSHPATTERVALSREHGKTLTSAARPADARDRKALFDGLGGLVIGENPAKGFFDENWFVHPELAFAMAFPPDWRGINSEGFVGAQVPDEETFVMLALVAQGADPMEGARTASRRLETNLVEHATTGTVNGLQAARSQAEISAQDGSKQKLEMTWIAHGGLIYQIMGVAGVQRFDAVQELMRRSANSFRALTDEERSRILISRLAVVEAQQGESFVSLAERVRTPWPAEVIAVVNGRPVTALLESGEPVKVGMMKNYTPRGRSAAHAEPPRLPVINRRP